ncbi:hypothetical protein [Brevibacterium litoralis]|uniref:hypothetical protein n=1 Tax=Brevibacterium litoralis TaxID=3138935 RepID=UPI0032ECB1C4
MSDSPSTPPTAPDADTHPDAGGDVVAPDGWQQPLVSIDVVAVAYAEEALHVLLAPRQHEPHRGELALPGVLLGRERSVEAAHRALSVKAGVDDPDAVMLQDAGVFDDPGRDPRGPTISITKLGVVGAGRLGVAATGQWVPVTDLPALPFDHAGIVAAVLRRLRTWTWKDRAVTEALFGPTFSSRDAAAVERQLAAATGDDPAHIDVANLKRVIKNSHWVRQTDTLVPRAQGRGRPSYLWEWIAAE